MRKAILVTTVLAMVMTLACSERAVTAIQEESGASFSELFGTALTNAEQQSRSVDSLEGKIVGVYFSAHWCPPCRVFTPKLVTFYNQLKSQGKPFEIVFVSFDKTEEAMFEYMKEVRMPWLALPHDYDGKQDLASRFRVRGIPMLVILDANGRVVTGNGRGDVGSYGVGAFDRWQ